jgi:hypothetical protein
MMYDIKVIFIKRKFKQWWVNNSTKYINKMNKHLSPQLTEHIKRLDYIMPIYGVRHPGLIKIKMLNRNICITKSNNKNLVFIMLSACHKLKRFWKNNYIQLQTVGTCTCMHNKIFVWLKKNQWHLLTVFVIKTVECND